MNRKTVTPLNTILIALTLALVLAGCQNLFDPPKASKSPAGTGAGTFTLEIGGVNAGRTILPAAIQPTEFAAYTLAFSGNGENLRFEQSADTLGEPVTLNAGTWNLTVTAYLDSAKAKPAARGNLAGIVINTEANTSGSLELKPIVEAGATGTFRWNIEYPSTVISASMTITPLDTTTGAPEQILYFIGGTGTDTTVNKDNSGSPLTLNTGYYLVMFSLNDGKHDAGRKEYLHIYQNMESEFVYEFTADYFTTALVTSEADSDTRPGTLRYAIANAPEDSTILIDAAVGTIYLEGRLTIDKSLTIRGNGVTLTRAASWTTVNSYSQLLYISGTTTVNISRIHFKDGRGTNNGAAVYTGGSTVNLESCVFSGNQASDRNNGGSAIYITGTSSTLTVQGCTFYGNSSAGWGGAVYVYSGTATLTGNLFYGNTAYRSPVVHRNGGTVSSGGYNVVDVELGTGGASSGFTAAADNTDKVVSGLPISPLSFRLLADGGAANVITTLPEGYPTADFYGNPISNGAASGAVQSTAGGAGSILALSVNNAALGSVSASPAPDADGIVSGAVTVTATPAEDFAFVYWLKDGVIAGDNESLSLDMTDHTILRAVFGRVVNNFTDAAGSATTPGTLRYALTTAQDGDVITFSGVTPGSTTIALESDIPLIDKSLIIQGKGITLTRAASWVLPISSSSLGMLRFRNDASVITVNISRVHFKDSRTSTSGAALDNWGANVNLESCIFSGNQTIYSAGNDGGGAIYNSNGGNLVVKGCTFYKNSSAKFGGAILAGGNSSISTTVLLTGNLFYGNTAASFGPVVYKLSSTTGSIVSTGYNVVDVTLGTGTDQSGFSASNNIGNIISLPISPVSFRPFAGGGATNVITTLPAGYPTVDFYGNPISNGAASGAVQGTAGGAGNILTLSVNNAALGSVSALPPPDADGFVSSTTVTAAPMTGYTFAYWLQDGVNIGNANQLSLNLTAHTTLQAVFGRVVNNFAADSATTPGTLRYALTNAQNGEAIICEGVTPGVTTITLESALPPIEKSLTIQGNGITLTRAASTTVDAWSQLLRIPNTSGYITVNISRIHFKDGRATAYGAAIHHGIGTLTLESCIFSGNQNSGSDGGAIYTSGPLVLRGCTFYENSSAGSGGAVYNVGSSSYGTDGVTTTLTGNLFYGNTAASGPVVSRYTASIYAKVASSRGYNVVDVTLGAGDTQSGFAAASGDSTFINRGISGDPFDTTTGDTAFTPNKAALNIVPANLAGFPLTDFYGNARTFPGAPGAVRTPY